MLQGMLLWIIALPIFQIDYQNAPLLQSTGFGLWLLGFLWEAIADWQLFRFKQQPENVGKVMKGGLWAYSRHPNYFGEIVLWWGIFLYVLSYSNLWIIIWSPITITWLLTRVSGVPMLEKKYRKNSDYQQYIKNSNALIPNLFAKKENNEG